MKLAFTLASLPFCWLIVAMALKLPLPSLPFINLAGNEAPEYIFFVANTTNNLPGSVYFVLACFAIGMGLFSYPALDRDSIKNAWQDIAKALKEDFASLLVVDDKKIASQEEKSNQKPAPKKEPIRKVIIIACQAKNETV